MLKTFCERPRILQERLDRLATQSTEHDIAKYADLVKLVSAFDKAKARKIGLEITLYYYIGYEYTIMHV